MSKKAILENVDFSVGLFTVKYIQNEDSITQTMAIPINSDGKSVSPQELIKIIKDRFPSNEFNRLSLQYSSEDQDAFKDYINQEIDIEGKTIGEPITDSAQPVEELIELYSKYGTRFEVNIVRNIVLQTLSDMGIIK
jgi:hypothetical protein